MKEKELVQVVGLCFLLLVLCVFITAFHVHRIFDAFEQSSYSYIINRSELSSKYFSENFERRGSLVAAEAQVLATDENIDKASIINCLKVLEETGEFSYARYISARGIKYSSNGSLNSTMLRDYEEVIDAVVPMTVYRNFAPERSNDEVCFASPVQKNGIIQGYVIGVANASRMFENSSSQSAASLVAERYLTDSRGNIVAYVKNNKIYDGTGKNIFDILTKDCIDD